MLDISIQSSYQGILPLSKVIKMFSWATTSQDLPLVTPANLIISSFIFAAATILPANAQATSPEVQGLINESDKLAYCMDLSAKVNQLQSAGRFREASQFQQLMAYYRC
jgi:hypothetical protein